MPRTETHTFRMTPELKEALEAEAERQERSVSWIIVKALEDALGSASGANAARAIPASTRAPRRARTSSSARQRHAELAESLDSPSEPEQVVAQRPDSEEAARQGNPAAGKQVDSGERFEQGKSSEVVGSVCPECGKANGVHRVGCSKHPRSKR